MLSDRTGATRDASVVEVTALIFAPISSTHPDGECQGLPWIEEVTMVCVVRHLRIGPGRRRSLLACSEIFVQKRFWVLLGMLHNPDYRG